MRLAMLSVAMVYGTTVFSLRVPGAEPFHAAEYAMYEKHALTRNGDARRGHALFKEKRTQCLTCHRVHDQGGDVGPDLSHIGGKFDRPHLIESVLDPSRQIVEGYRTSVIVTVDGQLRAGIVRSQSRDAVVLVGAEGKQRSVPRAEIAAQEDQAVSLMPTGLMDLLSTEEFTDLIAYLESLRPGGRPTPGAGVTGRIHLPPGFELDLIATRLTGCTALETTSDGRVFLCEQTGALRVVKDNKLLAEPFVRLSVDSTWERGLIGVTVAPGFPRVPYVYVCYVSKEPYPHHRVSRFTAAGDRAVRGSEKILLAGDDQRTLGGNVPAGHQGGGLHFGPDGRLYVGIGEQTAEEPSQDLGTFQGKLLRIHPDGGIPADNPFKEAAGKYRAIWARGFRNPFTFAFCPRAGDLFINDVGGKYEEINRGLAGGNYGWPLVDHGPLQDSPFEAPIHYYPQASIAGGDFAASELAWPGSYRGRYFFADFVHGWIKTLDPRDPEQATTFVTGLRRPVDLRFDGDGNLFVLLRNAWVIDDKFAGSTGSLLRIRYADSTTPAERPLVRSHDVDDL